MAGIRNKPRVNGTYQGFFTDSSGRRKFFAGTRNRAETLRMAQRFEDEHLQVRLGYRPASTKADKEKHRPFSELAAEYLAWGKSQGGRSNMPWGEVHARMRKFHLAWWEHRLHLKTISDLNGALPLVEAALRELQSQGKTGKTLQNYSEALCALCDWAVERGYLDDDPLKRLSAYDTSPQSYRRAMSPEEVQRLLQVAPPYRRLVYQVALYSGLRAKELRSLKVRDLNQDSVGLNLDARWTKNRKQGIQPIPRWLMDKLKEESKGKAPDEPLLFVPLQPIASLNVDLKAAGIPKWTAEGKVDFHSFRVIYITRVIEAGATVKEAQTLARHSTADLTMNTYAKTSPTRLKDLAEKLSQNMLANAACAPLVPKRNEARRFALGKSKKSKELDCDDHWRAVRDLNPRPSAPEADALSTELTAQWKTV
jgi:integrase